MTYSWDGRSSQMPGIDLGGHTGPGPSPRGPGRGAAYDPGAG